MTRIAAIVATLALSLSAGTALAECRYNGEIVPEGTRIGGFVCIDGEWVEG